MTKYADFKGRASRAEYWWFVLFVVAVYLAAVMLASAAKGPAIAVIFLGVVLPPVAAAIRRLHDTGKSGWWYLIGLVPYAGGIILLILLAQASQPVSNAYGPRIGALAAPAVGAPVLPAAPPARPDEEGAPQQQQSPWS